MGTFDTHVLRLSPAVGVLLTLATACTDKLGGNVEQANLRERQPASVEVPSTTAGDEALPDVTIATPAEGSSVGAAALAGFVVGGACTEEGLPVVVTGAADVSVPCTGGAWSTPVDLSAAAEGSLVLTATHTKASSSLAHQATRTIIKDTVPPTVELTVDIPADVAPGSLTRDVATTDLARYRFQLSDTTCSETDYSELLPAATALTLTLETPGARTLCLLGEDFAGNQQLAPTRISFFVLGHRDVTPAAAARSETVVRLTWSPASGDVKSYDIYLSASPGDEPDFAATPAATGIPPDATSADVSGIGPGSQGRAVVRARVAETAATSAASGTYWTPFGALNQPHVNGTVATVTGYGGMYAESQFISPTFSMITGHFYAPEFTYVFDHVPQNGELPAFSPNSWTVATPGYNLRRLNDYGQMWSDGVNKLAVVTNGEDKRVLIYDALPTSPDKATPARVIGQHDATGGAANAGDGAINAVGFAQPTAACFNGTHLYVVDSGNHRVMVYNGWPTATGQAANSVIGQPNLTTGTANYGGLSRSSFNAPNGLDCADGRLIVTDAGNHRVMIWNTAPTVTTPADVILGQSDETTNAANGAGGVGVGGVNNPFTPLVMEVGGVDRLLLSDEGNNRVIQWNSIPTTDGAAFDSVYGQPDRTTATENTGGLSKNSLRWPFHLAREHGSNRFWVADFGNGRHVIYEFNQTEAVGVWGNRSGSNGEGNWGSFTPTHHSGVNRWTGWTGNEPTGVGLALDPDTGLAAYGNRLWAQPPLDNTPPTMWRSVPDLYTDPSTTATSSVSGGFGCLATIGARTYWCDGSRILSRAGGFTTGHEAAEHILGRFDMAGGAATANTNVFAISPTGLARVGTRLLAIDGPRIVGWNAPAQASNQAIDFALGQSSTADRTANSGGVTASTLSAGVTAILVHEGKLYAVDRDNHRVLIWNNAATVGTGDPADTVLGQGIFTTATSGTGLAQMNHPVGIAVSGGKLLVSDRSNSRLLVWDTLPTVSGTAASRAVDTRTLFRFSLPDWFDGNALTPGALSVFGGRLYLGMYDRVLIIPEIF